MFECPLCAAQYGDPASARWCRDICAEDERVARAVMPAVRRGG